mgnify:CR=1 FL=1
MLSAEVREWLAADLAQAAAEMGGTWRRLPHRREGVAVDLALGGAGVLVGPPRQTLALYRLPSVAGVAEWLTECA